MWLDHASGAGRRTGDAHASRAQQQAHPHAQPHAQQRASHWDAHPAALTEGTLVRVATAAAARAGVRTGMTTAQARAKCAGLALLPWDAAVIGRETARASAAFLIASPLVSPARDTPGAWWVGADGLEGLGGERVLAATLLDLARAWHPNARVAVADSCVTAYAATWSRAARGAAHGASNGAAPNRPGPVHVPPGGDRDYLMRVPISLLPMDVELRETLGALGLRTAGAFAVLDPLEVERRWGADGLAAWRLARGDDARRATLARTDDPRAIRHELATSAPTMEPVLFLVRASLDRLVGALASDGLAAAAVAITLTLEDNGPRDDTGDRRADVDDQHLRLDSFTGITVTREARPARPVARAAPLFERCRALLDTWTVEAPITAVEIRITATAHSSAEQGDLLMPSWRDPAAAESALARLRNTLGAGSVVRPVRRDSHAPERAAAWEDVEQAATAAPVDSAVALASTKTEPAARLLESPESIAITTDKRGVPLLMFWRGRRITIARADGPERLSGEWWHAEPFARDYWRCESDELGQDLLVYRDAKGWRLQGWYD